MNRGYRPLRLLIVGGVAAGMSAAARARRNDQRAEITVVQKEDVLSYSACGFPYLFAGDLSREEQLIARDPAWFRGKNIEMLTRHEALRIDVRRKAVVARNLLDGSQKSLLYDRLILATGARAVVPQIEGRGLDGVFTLRHWNDARKISDFLQRRNPKSALIVGAGYTGLEMAEALARKGLSVTIVEKNERLLRSADEEINRYILNSLRLNNVQIHCGRTVGAFTGEDVVKNAVLDNGRELAAELVLISAGIKPQVSLAREADLRLGPNGAIAVNNSMQTSEHTVFAAGDCAETRHLLTRKAVWLPLGTTANKQGRVAADNACGISSVFKGVMGTSVVRLFDLEVGQTGLGMEEAAKHFGDVESVAVEAPSRAGYFPGAQKVTVKLVFRKNDGLLLGGHLCGREGVAKRVDVLATALAAKMTLADLSELDLSYAPPFAPVWDPLLVAANVGLKKIRRKI